MSAVAFCSHLRPIIILICNWHLFIRQWKRRRVGLRRDNPTVEGENMIDHEEMPFVEQTTENGGELVPSSLRAGGGDFKSIKFPLGVFRHSNGLEISNNYVLDIPLSFPASSVRCIYFKCILLKFFLRKKL